MTGFQELISDMMDDPDVGQTVWYNHVAGESFDVATRTNNVTYDAYPVKASIRDYSVREIVDNVKRGDRKATIAGADLPFTPVKDDTLTVNGATFTIVGVETRNVGADAGLHVLQIRGFGNG